MFNGILKKSTLTPGLYNSFHSLKFRYKENYFPKWLFCVNLFNVTYIPMLPTLGGLLINNLNGFF